MKSKATKFILWASGIGLIVYLVGWIGFYMLQDKIIFQHKKLDKEYSFRFDQPFEEHFIQTEDGETLNALLFRTQKPSKGLVLYFHGNADNLQRWGEYAVDFTQLDYDILLMDYRGYGKSTGAPTEIDFYKDAVTISVWAKVNIPYASLIIYGRSLGAAVASNLATVSNPDLLILETPFDDLKGSMYVPLGPLLNIFPLQYEFSTKTFLSKVICKKVIIHGTKDRVVPLSSALRLKPLLGVGDQFVIIEGGGHRNLREFESYHTTLANALRGDN